MTASDDTSSPHDPVRDTEHRFRAPLPVRPTTPPHGSVGNGNSLDGQPARLRSVIPDQPGELMRSPGALQSLYVEAIAEIERARGRALGTGRYASQTRDSVFKAALGAFSDSCRSIVAAAHTDSEWARMDPEHPDMRVVAAGPGSGKTTYAKAFAVALGRLHATHGFPIGCAFLVHHVDTADAFYRELSSLMPGHVARSE